MTRPAVAVVGAGIVGCAIAREIASRDPGARVVVLDQDVIGSGTTLRSAGMHVPRGATERLRRMSALSHDRYERMRAADRRLPIRPVGVCVIFPEADEAARRGCYLPCAALTPAAGPPDELVRVPAGCSAWDARGCHHADVGGVARAMAREVRPRVSFLEGVRVTAVDLGAGAVTLRLGTGGSLTAARVVLAPGPWLAAPAWSELVAPLGLRVKKIVALHLDRAPRAGDRAVIFEEEDAFLLPLPDRGHWLFSYTCPEWDVVPATVAAGLSADNLREAGACLERYAPVLVERVAGGRVFCDAYSPEREPRVQALDGEGRLVFAGAAGGSGYRLAPAIAVEAAELLGIR